MKVEISDRKNQPPFINISHGNIQVTGAGEGSSTAIRIRNFFPGDHFTMKVLRKDLGGLIKCLQEMQKNI